MKNRQSTGSCDLRSWHVAGAVTPHQSGKEVKDQTEGTLDLIHRIVQRVQV
jgi:hypothetical protein